MSTTAAPALWAGLEVTAGCTPVQVHEQALTLDCAGQLYNPGPDRLFVCAIAVTPDGGQGASYEFVLDPGAPAAGLPDPPTGGWWAIATETGHQVAVRGAWAFVFFAAVGGFAGLGIAEVLTGLVQHWRRRR